MNDETRPPRADDPTGRSFEDPYESPRSDPSGAGAAWAVESGDRNQALLAHLLTFTSWIGIPGFIGPLVLWLMRKDEQTVGAQYVADHAKESLNFQITMFLAFLISTLLALVLVGFILIPIVILLDIILPIIATVKAGQGEDYEYPFCIRFIG